MIRYNPLDPDQDLDLRDEPTIPTEDPGSGVLPLSPHFERLALENRQALRPPPIPADLPTIPMQRPFRARVADFLDGVGDWWSRGFGDFVALVRGRP